LEFFQISFSFANKEGN